MTRDVDPWLEPYLSDFATVRQILQRTPGFLFLPIETPSPDLGLALGAWLAGEGIPNVVHELREAVDWDELVLALGSPNLSRRRSTIVVVVETTPKESDIRRPLSLLNMARDAIAQTNARILWCGDAEFHQLTRRIATDLWSIAGSPYTIPLRRLHDVPSHWPGRANWWTDAVKEDIVGLQERAEESASDPNRTHWLHTMLKLAEALLARGDVIGARARLEEIEAEIPRHTPLLLPRWNELSLAARAASEPAGEKTLEQLQHDLERAQALGAERQEALIRVRMAVLNESLQRSEAFSEFARAREIWARLGDRGQVLEIDTLLVLDYALSLDPSLKNAIRNDAIAAADAEDPELAVRAEVILAKLALMSERLQEAVDHAERAYRGAEGTSVEVLRIPTLQLHAYAEKLRGAHRSALALASDALMLSKEAERPLSMVQTRLLIADILEAQECPLDAAKQVIAAMGVVGGYTEDILNGTLMVRLSSLAHAVGNDDVATALFLLGVYWILPHWRHLASLLASGERLDELLDALPTAKHTVSRLLEFCRNEANSVDEGQLTIEETSIGKTAISLSNQLARQGVEVFNPDTWMHPSG